jgi:hypothetical protein
MSEHQPTSPTPAEDLAGYLRTYVGDLLDAEDALEVLFDRFHVPEFTHDHDGVHLDRDRILAHTRAARRNVTAVELDIHSALISGSSVAARYTLRSTMRKGPELVSRVWMFGELAPGGRLRSIVSTGRTEPA